MSSHQSASDIYQDGLQLPITNYDPPYWEPAPLRSNYDSIAFEDTGYILEVDPISQHPNQTPCSYPYAGTGHGNIGSTILTNTMSVRSNNEPYSKHTPSMSDESNGFGQCIIQSSPPFTGDPLFSEVDSSSQMTIVPGFRHCSRIMPITTSPFLSVDGHISVSDSIAGSPASSTASCDQWETSSSPSDYDCQITSDMFPKTGRYTVFSEPTYEDPKHPSIGVPFTTAHLEYVQHAFIHVAQRRYKQRSQKELDAHPIYFRTRCNVGFQLGDALRDNFTVLADRDSPVFEGGGSSISLRLHFDLEGFSSWSHQIKTKNWRCPPQPITLSKLAKEIAKTVDKYLQCSPEGNICSKKIVIDDLTVVSLRQVSKASWQPVLMIRKVW